METFTFTREQLNTLLFDTIGMFLEYRDVHDRTEEQAKFAAVSEMFEGLDADKELVLAGEIEPVLQIVDLDPLGIEEEYGQRPAGVK